MVAPHETFRPSPDIVTRRIRGEHVLVPIRSSSAALDSIYTLNATAGFIWEKARSGISASDISLSLAKHFLVETDTATADTSRVLQELVAIGALIPHGKAI